MTGRVVRRVGAAGATSLVAALMTPGTVIGSGGTYEVVQCDPLNRAVAGAVLEDAPAYAVKQGCGDPTKDHAIKISNTRYAKRGRSGRVRWATNSPALRIVGASVQAKLRRDLGHRSRLWMANGANEELARVASGGRTGARFRNYSWHTTGLGAERFIAQLRCDHRGGCKHSDVAKTWVRDVRFEVADYAKPRLDNVGGSLMHPGWIRGDQTVYVGGSDVGSGVQRIVIEVNQQPMTSERGVCDEILGTHLSQVFSPCQSGLGMGAQVATTTTPFMDGRNDTSVCVLDFAGNPACRAHTVYVDNTPPSLSFANVQNPNDPELIRVRALDSMSGVAAGRIYYRAVGATVWRPLATQRRNGQLLARIDSTIDPPGRYEFMARATDVAGNTRITTLRSDGQPMILTFPLKSGVQLQAHLRGGSRRLTVGYARSSKVAGVLRDAFGEPLVDQDVTVTENFGDGALIDTRVRTVHTDSRGRWKERLPGGPSRAISASYAGTPRYLPDTASAGALRVKTKASLRLSKHRVPEGHRVLFKGRIRHLAARIPAGGKLVELEVKDGRSWHTVRHPFYTRPNGRYRLKYRFARFYVSNVRYRFRVRVLREREWPYKAPVSSRVRKLVVKAR